MDVQTFVTWLALLAGLAGALVPIVSGVVAVIKTALGERLPARYLPAVSVAVGVLLSELAAWIAPATATGPMLDWRQGLLIGVLAGLGAAKLFEYGKRQELTVVTSTSTSTSTATGASTTGTAASSSADPPAVPPRG